MCSVQWHASSQHAELSLACCTSWFQSNSGEHSHLKEWHGRTNQADSIVRRRNARALPVLTSLPAVVSVWYGLRHSKLEEQHLVKGIAALFSIWVTPFIDTHNLLPRYLQQRVQPAGRTLSPSPSCKPVVNSPSNTRPFLQVLHIRNLPYETTEEELRELCAPFGRLVQSKLNVGANKNQAFVEFPDQASAINMVSYFASSADPAKVHQLASPPALRHTSHAHCLLVTTWSFGLDNNECPAEAASLSFVLQCISMAVPVCI